MVTDFILSDPGWRPGKLALEVFNCQEYGIHYAYIGRVEEGGCPWRRDSLVSGMVSSGR